MITIFYDLIHKLVEVYVDDILGNSTKRENHLDDLKSYFENNEIISLKAKS